MSLWDPDIQEYAKELTNWCYNTGNIQFHHHDLPDRLQSPTAKMIRRARDKGYVKKVRIEKYGTLWELTNLKAITPFFKISQYMVALKTWCDKSGKKQFKHSDLPAFLQTQNGGLLRRASYNGYLNKISIDPKTNVSIWEIRRVK